MIKFDALDNIEDLERDSLYANVIEVSNQLLDYFRNVFKELTFYIEEIPLTSLETLDNMLCVEIPEQARARRNFTHSLDFYIENPNQNGYRVNLFSICLNKFSFDNEWILFKDKITKVNNLEKEIFKKDKFYYFKSKESFGNELNETIKQFNVPRAILALK